tara:strand:+ start:79 stop:231 length:153 start_codon:yes stop_codon:yes gene_type:complete
MDGFAGYQRTVSLPYLYAVSFRIRMNLRGINVNISYPVWPAIVVVSLSVT